MTLYTSWKVYFPRNPHSTKIKICRHCLTHMQRGPDTLKDDGVHAKSHRAFYTGILPIALQGIPHFAADCSSLRINIGDGTARTGLDRFQQDFFSACRYVHHAQPVFIVRMQSRQHDVGPKSFDADAGMACGHQSLVQLCKRRFAEHQEWISITEQVEGLHTACPIRTGSTPVRGIESD